MKKVFIFLFLFSMFLTASLDASRPLSVKLSCKPLSEKILKERVDIILLSISRNENNGIFSHQLSNVVCGHEWAENVKEYLKKKWPR